MGLWGSTDQACLLCTILKFHWILSNLRITDAFLGIISVLGWRSRGALCSLLHLCSPGAASGCSSAPTEQTSQPEHWEAA